MSLGDPEKARETGTAGEDNATLLPTTAPKEVKGSLDENDIREVLRKLAVVLAASDLLTHLDEHETAKFVADNVQSFGPKLLVELSSEEHLSSRLLIHANSLTPKTLEVLTHMHLNNDKLTQHVSLPIGLEDGEDSKLKEQLGDYICSIIQDDNYVKYATETMDTQLPRKVLGIAQRYYKRSDSPVMKLALSIHAMGFVMTRHLTLTKGAIRSLRSELPIPDASHITCRVLNRQLKVVVYLLLKRDLQTLLENFFKPPESPKASTPRVIAFLVLCLFMEEQQVATMRYSIANKSNKGAGDSPESNADFTSFSKRIEDGPFREIASHVRISNPVANEALAKPGDLADANAELARSLRELLQGDSLSELKSLAKKEPSDQPNAYAGRLTAKALLSLQSGVSVPRAHL